MTYLTVSLICMGILIFLTEVAPVGYQTDNEFKYGEERLDNNEELY